MNYESNNTLERIRAEIIYGVLATDAPLRQDQIAKRLCVSRTPVRQALERLAGEGLVDYDRNRGARVAPIRADDVRDLFDIRVALEPIALAEAMPLHDKLVWAEAEIALDRADETKQASELSRANSEFHAAIYSPCRRTLLLDTIRRLTSRGIRAEIAALSMQTRIAKSAEEHRKLLDACRDGDPRRACKVLERHLIAARNDTLNFLCANLT